MLVIFLVSFQILFRKMRTNFIAHANLSSVLLWKIPLIFYPSRFYLAHLIELIFNRLNCLVCAFCTHRRFYATIWFTLKSGSPMMNLVRSGNRCSLHKVLLSCLILPFPFVVSVWKSKILHSKSQILQVSLRFVAKPRFELTYFFLTSWSWNRIVLVRLALICSCIKLLRFSKRTGLFIYCLALIK